jgi:hypothetical protein
MKQAPGALIPWRGRRPFHLSGLPAGTPPLVLAGWWWRLRARAPFAVALSGALLFGVEACFRRRLIRCPASVARRTQATPPPCRHPPSHAAFHALRKTRIVLEH